MAALGKRGFKHVVVGGGVSGGYAIQELIAQGVPGADICLVSAEGVCPYERPALTKAYLHHPGAAARARLPGFHTCVGGGGERHTPEKYQELGVTVLLNTKVSAVDYGKKECTLEGDADGGINYETSLLLCPGAAAGNPMPQMYYGPNVFSVRSEADAAKLIATVEGEGAKGGLDIVCIGGGYIGVEIAAGLAGWKSAAGNKGLGGNGGVKGDEPSALSGSDFVKSVTIVNMDERLLFRNFGAAAAPAAFLQAQCEKKGVRVLNSTKVASLTRGEGSDKVVGVELVGGSTLPCDVLVLGLGSAPNTAGLFPDAAVGADQGPRGRHVAVDGLFRVKGLEDAGVFAFGDVAAFPYKEADGSVSITPMEHVAHARKSAKHAVQAALGKLKADDPNSLFSTVPFYYSRLFEWSERPVIWNMFGSNTCAAAGDGGYVSLDVASEAADLHVSVFLNDKAEVVAGAVLGSPSPPQALFDGVRAMVEARVALGGSAGEAKTALQEKLGELHEGFKGA